MAGHACAHCGLRKKYDNNPDSLLGRFWRWHTKWCPGWRSYTKSLSPEERKQIAEHYDLKKFK